MLSASDSNTACSYGQLPSCADIGQGDGFPRPPSCSSDGALTELHPETEACRVERRPLGGQRFSRPLGLTMPNASNGDLWSRTTTRERWRGSKPPGLATAQSLQMRTCGRASFDLATPRASLGALPVSELPSRTQLSTGVSRRSLDVVHHARALDRARFTRNKVPEGSVDLPTLDL